MAKEPDTKQDSGKGHSRVTRRTFVTGAVAAAVVVPTMAANHERFLRVAQTWKADGTILAENQ